MEPVPIDYQRVLLVGGARAGETLDVHPDEQEVSLARGVARHPTKRGHTVATYERYTRRWVWFIEGMESPFFALDSLNDREAIAALLACYGQHKGN